METVHVESNISVIVVLHTSQMMYICAANDVYMCSKVYTCIQ